ncbi:DUF5789 family protein [Haloquadratum walsbyi]|jgi:hypothetical protein|uniref:Uncharacterized protein n=1 Tax=Haloquadratum walsbyi J07HQW2 TaxID=1238425 RepID=U1NHR3_9EURY|nr:MAG: hypothetical protein J07HQW2_02881 [Haloquadratum walsbyi J07HQW2]
MADEAEGNGDDEPIVELGEKTPVAGQPLARVAARLTWPHEVSRIIDQEGESMIRTPTGPRQLESVLMDVDDTYIDSRQTFVSAVEDVIGNGPVETESHDANDNHDGESTTDADTDGDADPEAEAV